MSTVEEFSEVYWMDIRHGKIAASDKNGKVSASYEEKERYLFILNFIFDKCNGGVGECGR